MTGKKFEEFVDVIRALRDPKTGCPWDIEQTHDSIRRHLIEECYELLDAIERGDDAEFAEELGDVLLQVVLHAQIARDRNAFTVDDVIQHVHTKIVRRHPHVFGDTKVTGTDEVFKNWERIKAEEYAEKGKQSDLPPVFAGLPQAMPALILAERIGEKSRKVNFDWNSTAEVWNKVKEEIAELADELGTNPPAKTELSEKQKQAITHELGDVLFSLAQLGRWLGISAEFALRECCSRFFRRFREMTKATDKPLADLSNDELEALWQTAKKRAS